VIVLTYLKIWNSCRYLFIELGMCWLKMRKPNSVLRGSNLNT
jgi:hypothetical protein